MNRTLKKLAIVAGTAIPAAAMFFGTAAADVSPQSKVKNGTFDNNTTYWHANPDPLPSVTLTQTGGLLKVINTENTWGATQGYAYQCFAVDANTKYELSGKVYLANNLKRQGQVNMGLVFYEGYNCTGAKAGGAYTLAVTQNASWKQQSVAPISGEHAKSAMVRLQVQKYKTNIKADASVGLAGYFDDIQVVKKIMKLPGGPIVIGNPQPNPDPTPAPNPDPQPQPDPNPQPNPQPQPDPQPQEDPAPQENPAPQDEPVEDAPSEQPAPGPQLPEEAPVNYGDSDDAPAGADTSDDSVDSAPSGEGADATDNTGVEPESDVQTLGETDKGNSKPASKPSNGQTQPTPAAPETGNATSDDGTLLGTNEMAVVGVAGLVGLGLALIALSRRGRKPATEDDYIIG